MEQKMTKEGWIERMLKTAKVTRKDKIQESMT